MAFVDVKAIFNDGGEFDLFWTRAGADVGYYITVKVIRPDFLQVMKNCPRSQLKGWMVGQIHDFTRFANPHWDIKPLIDKVWITEEMEGEE